jgi:hypothetical protein
VGRWRVSLLADYGACLTHLTDQIRQEQSYTWELDCWTMLLVTLSRHLAQRWRRRAVPGKARPAHAAACARPLPQPQTSPSCENRVVAAWEARQTKAAAAGLRGGEGALHQRRRRRGGTPPPGFVRTVLFFLISWERKEITSDHP